MKWNPGHYIRPDTIGWAPSDADRFAAYDKIRNNAAFKGGLMIAPWGSLEPQKGQYDFSQIDKDLAYLKGMNKKLIIEIWYMTFGGTIPGSVPQNDPKAILPDYIIAGGGASVQYSGYTVRLQEQQWMDRLIALYQALGARYDNDPGVEQIVITETAAHYDGIDNDKTHAQYMRLLPAVRAAFAHTPVVIYANYHGGPSHTESLVRTAAGLGIGIGGPDILPAPPAGAYEDWGSRALRGAGNDKDGNWGTTDYRGRVPVSYSYEGGFSRGPANLINYAVDTLKATHLVWGPYDYMGPLMGWSAVLSAVGSRTNGIVTACPTAYNGNCAP